MNKVIFILLQLVNTIVCDTFGVIESCSGWKLNRYPVIKEFLKGDSGATIYKHMQIEYIPGHNPDLVVKKPNPIRIDLTQYKTEEDLHELMILKGFIIGDADHRKNRCEIWTKNDFCNKYSTYMHTYCKDACNKVEL